MPLLLYAQPHLKYDLKLSVNENMNLHTTIDIHVKDITTDLLRFRFGNALIEYWAPTLSLANCNYTLDTANVEKVLNVYTSRQTSVDFSIHYCFIPFVSTAMHSKATLYDNRGFENFLPELLEEYTLEIGNMVVEVPAGFEFIHPHDIKKISDFYLLAYRTSDCRDRGRKTLGRMSIDYRLFTDSLSTEDQDFLFDRIFSFWPLNKSTLHICEMPWLGNTSICDLLIYNSRAFRSTVLYHELMHLWINPDILDDGMTGRYFLSETLNEYLMLQYIRKIAPDKYRQIIDSKQKILSEGPLNTSQALINITKYVSSNHNYLMNYGVVVLSDFAKQVGEERFLKFIEDFYKNSRKHKYGYPSFRQQLIESFGEQNCTRFIHQIEEIPEQI